MSYNYRDQNVIRLSNINNLVSWTKLQFGLTTLANGHSSESTQRELSNEYQHDRVLDGFQKSLRPCSLDKSSLSIGRVKLRDDNPDYIGCMETAEGQLYVLGNNCGE